MHYRPEIDGLRAFAVTAVIFFHAGFDIVPGGFVGVDVFFVISGFLITTIIANDLKHDNFSLISFLERRARRILPSLFCVMLACIPVAFIVFLPQDLVAFSKSLIAVSIFVSNVLFWAERGYFSTAAELKPLIHTWSLSVEEQFYFFFPFILMITKSIKVIKISVLATLFLVSFFLSILITPIHQDTAFYLLPTRLWELLIGSGIAMILSKEQLREYLAFLPSKIFEIIGLILLLYSIMFFNSLIIFPGYLAILPVLGTALIIVFSSQETFLGKILGFRGFVFIGLISYSAYLWHQPLFAFLKYYRPATFENYRMILIFLVFVFSFISWKYIEKPWRSNRFSRKTLLFGACGGVVAFCLIGALGILSNGFIARFGVEDRKIFTNFVNAGAYVAERFDRVKLQEFDMSSEKKKILVIGDSFGKDLVNGLYESKIINDVQISTFQINSKCGNLFLSEDFTSKIDPAHLPRCRVLGWYDNPKLVSLMKNADTIWLASAWSDWVAERLMRSVSNLEREFNKPIFIFGTKNFGAIDPKILQNIPVEQRSTYRNQINIYDKKLQEQMKLELKGKKYIEISAAFCDDDLLMCRVFNHEREPFSFDGEHLTKAGAKELGKYLDKLQSVRSLFD